MKECETCANYVFVKTGYCQTMMKKPTELRCYMTPKDLIKAEQDIMAYSNSPSTQKKR